MLDARSWMLDSRYWILVSRCSIMQFGTISCSVFHRVSSIKWKLQPHLGRQDTNGQYPVDSDQYRVSSNEYRVFNYDNHHQKLDNLVVATMIWSR